MFASRIRNPRRWLWAGLLPMLAGPALARDCWVELYDRPDYQGSLVRIEGPKELPSLKNLDKQDWSDRIESLKVGQDAEVIAFRQENFDTRSDQPVNHPQAVKVWGEKDLPSYRELLITFGPGKVEHHLADVNFHQAINSLKVQCLR
jgi:hypothetical protein